MVDSIVYPGLVHLNGCLMAAVDLETTGTRPGWHEIVQIAVVPLNSDFKVLEDVRPFYTHVKPKHPERESEAAKQKHKIPMSELLLHAPEADRVADWLYDWFMALRLPFKKCLVPLAEPTAWLATGPTAIC